MKIILVGTFIVALLVACTDEPDDTGPVFDLAAGKAIAEAKCSECHEPDGRGATPDIPNLAAQPVQYLIEAMHAYRDGGRLHAALQDMTTGMSEADIANIAAYYANLAPLRNASSYSSADNKEGSTVAALCEECHGEKGVSTTGGVPNLAGQQPAYLIAATLEYKSGNRGQEDKGEMLIEVDQVDVEKMAMYFASQAVPVREAPPFGDPVAGEADAASCSRCHGEHGVSLKTMVPSLAAQEPVYLVNASKSYRNHGRSDDTRMPVKTDEQINNIAAYYATQSMTAPVNETISGREMAVKCDRCHNPPSGNRKANTPILRGQHYDYLVKSMKEYRDTDRENSMMHKMSAAYSDEMIEALAYYYASQ